MSLFYLSDKYNLTELEQSILESLYTTSSDIRKLGIRTLAKNHFTSTATIYKLAHKLGFLGYADMIYNLYYKKMLPTQAPTTPYESIENSLLDKKENFTKILNMYKNKNIIVTGMGFSQIIADYMCESLFLKGFRITSKLHIQLLDKEKSSETLLIIISQSGDTKRLYELGKIAKKHNIKIISFTSSSNNKLTTLSDLSFNISTDSNLKTTNNYFFAETIIAFEFLTSLIT
ncbi:MAG: MurR/RpiR family transcriptional regulator [Sarcina sp.]